MLDKIRALALEKLGSEQAVDAFMEGFQKEAAAGMFGQHATRFFTNPLIGKAAVGLGTALLGAAIVKGVSTGSNAYENNQLRHKFDMALAQVMSTNKIVKGARPEKVHEFAETFFRFAPHVASDPNLLGSILSNAVLGESIDPQTIKTLVDLEGRYTDNHRTTPLVGIKA